MKLAAIYNVWDGLELLYQSIATVEKHVNLIIIVYQDTSNFGEVDENISSLMHTLKGLSHFYDTKLCLVKYDPIIEMGGSMNERAKRNLGIDFARQNHCTHFIAMDVDEFYEDFGAAKELYKKCGHKGTVCKLQTYFKKPTFQFDRPEDYYVPFIHELNEDTKSGSSTYPFYVDPTRAINESDVVELPIFMHHFSWCRKDIEQKARNSSARIKIHEGNILKDYHSPDIGDGYFLINWNRKIKVVPDLFGLSPIFE